MDPTTDRINLDTDTDDDELMLKDEPYTPPQQSDFPNCTPQDVAKGVEIWVQEFKQALSLKVGYEEHHDHITDGFQLLSRLAYGMGAAKGTIIEHIMPIMKDMYFRGWKPALHSKSLIAAYRRWNKSKPVEEWEPPVDAGPRGSVRAARIKAPRPGNWLAPLNAAEEEAEKRVKGKGKAKEVEKKGTKKTTRESAPAASSKRGSMAGVEVVLPKTPAPGRGKKGVSRPTVDSEDDADDEVPRPVNATPCVRCAEMSLVCTIQDPAPSRKVGGKPVVIHVCGPCAKAKAKCSAVPPPAGVRKGRKVSEEAVSDGEVAGATDAPSTSKTPRVPRPRKKNATTPVPAGGPGELGKSVPHGLLLPLTIAFHSGFPPGRRGRRGSRSCPGRQRAPRGEQGPPGPIRARRRSKPGPPDLDKQQDACVVGGSTPPGRGDGKNPASASQDGEQR